MTREFDCVLTLAIPDSLEEEILDLLVAHTDIVSGFSVHAAEGLGSGAPLRTSLERVRGRSRRKMITLLLQQEQAGVLIERLRVQIPSADVAWWSTPLTGFGRLA